MKYITNDGQTYLAGTPEALIEVMRADSKTPTHSIEDFMGKTSQRCLLQTGAIVPISSAEDFVNGLIEAGFLTVVDDE